MKLATRRLGLWDFGLIAVLAVALTVRWAGGFSTLADAQAETPPVAEPSVAAPTTPAAAAAPQEIALFDGKTLANWAVTEFAAHGEPAVEAGALRLPFGEALTGVTWAGPPLPKDNYEIELEAQRVDGTDFFVGLTFPVGDDPCSLILGGWGGGVVGLSSLDGRDASENETTQYMQFENGRWYKVRLRVVPKQILVWLDGEQIIDVPRGEKKFSVRAEVEQSRPLGFASWQTTAALRNLKLRKLAENTAPEPQASPAE